MIWTYEPSSQLYNSQAAADVDYSAESSHVWTFSRVLSAFIRLHSHALDADLSSHFPSITSRSCQQSQATASAFSRRLAARASRSRICWECLSRQLPSGNSLPSPPLPSVITILVVDVISIVVKKDRLSVWWRD